MQSRASRTRSSIPRAVRRSSPNPANATINRATATRACRASPWIDVLPAILPPTLPVRFRVRLPSPPKMFDRWPDQ